MFARTPNELVQKRNRIFPRAFRWLGKAVALMAWFGLLGLSHRGVGGETPLSEYQVKALFLLNFTKYVTWPPEAVAETNTPIMIGIYGEDKFGEALLKAVESKVGSGRRVIIQPIAKDDDFGKCHILFISDSEKKRLGEILTRTKALPVLTIGETDQFLEKGGVINFVKKGGKIRLEINLDAARQANLQISSKLLSVADVVKGK